MTNFLYAKNKIGLVNGSMQKPESTSPMYMARMRADAMVKGWLTTAMEKDIRTSIRYANTVAEIWKDLEERSEKEGAPRAYELKQSLNVARQDGASISSYYTKLKAVWDEIQLVLPMPRCTCSGCSCALGKRFSELKEKEKIYEFLMGLDADFSIIRTQILAMKPTPSLTAIYHLVAEDEQQRAIFGGSKRISDEAATFQVDLAEKKVTRGQTTRATNKTLPRAFKQNNDKAEKCTFCGKDGHNKDGCFKKIGYPDWWPGKKDKPKPKATCVGTGPSPIPGITNEQYDLFVKHFK
ncbi:uncharacterized protein LOC111886631 [Lactuca sativa]|uniref:uncharacterized protein LOC111886631 n=1 Tax=Lactuca sativa TaxID=4236 RepID=UPI000CD9C466|nr:uncharacterized protein LOC111886631 [Lactuca sativa]